LSQNATIFTNKKQLEVLNSGYTIGNLFAACATPVAELTILHSFDCASI
jgi:hypothetical protein